MSGKIFVLRDGDGLTVLTQTPYENEGLFQSLIEKHPEILAGEQINPDNPRKWVLISREMGVPLDDKWGSLDHLYIDQDAIPTFLEVKRGTDTRVRREVVGQMLDYAANAIQYWPIQDIRTAYERNMLGEEATTLSDIGIEDEDAFWQNVDLNLRKGKVRLLFVADIIPTSLQAIIEFLNEQMRDTEVYGLEIKQFLSNDGLTTLVPNLVGRTASAVRSKQVGVKAIYYDREDFLRSVSEVGIKELYNKMFAFTDEKKHYIEPGTSGFSMSAVDSSGKKNYLFYGFGDDAPVGRRNRIETTFDKLQGITSEILDHYIREIGNLAYFEKIQGSKYNNYKWSLTSKSTDEEMQMFLSVIQGIADKLLTIGNNDNG